MAKFRHFFGWKQARQTGWNRFGDLISNKLFPIVKTILFFPLLLKFTFEFSTETFWRICHLNFVIWSFPLNISFWAKWKKEFAILLIIEKSTWMEDLVMPKFYFVSTELLMDEGNGKENFLVRKRLGQYLKRMPKHPFVHTIGLFCCLPKKITTKQHCDVHLV